MTERRITSGAIIAAIPALLVVTVLVVHAQLAHSLNVNWDEFNFLAKIHTYARGELTASVLTFHVHFLGWVRETSVNEVMQVVRIRDAMFVLSLVTAAAVFFIGRRLLDSVAGALFAVFAGQSFSLVLDHGTSARYDPIVVCLFLVSAALLVSRWPRAPIIAGVVAALGMLVSIKSVFYVPTLAGLLLCRVAWDSDRRATVRAALSFALAAVLAFVALYSLHDASLADASPSAAADAPASTIDSLGGIASGVFLPIVGLARRGVLVDSLRWDHGFWALLAVGFVLTVLRLRRRETRMRDVQLLCFGLPLLTLLFYRNSFVYFYVSIIPPAALLAGVLVGRIEQRFAQRPLLALALVALVAAPSARSAFLWWSYNSDDQLGVQTLVVDVVHATFPKPVPYVDRCGMISSFRKVGPFMSTWTMAEYKKRGTPIMRELLQRERPLFLVENITALDIARPYGKSRRAYRFVPEDYAALQQSFIPHWGPLWVAGKTVGLTPDVPADLELLIAGRYAVEAHAPITLDGRTTAPGDVVDLAGGPHVISSSVAQEVTLRTASARPPPSTPPPPPDLFRGFRYRVAAAAPTGDDDEEGEP